MTYKVREYFDKSVGVYDSESRRLLVLKDRVITTEGHIGEAVMDIPERDLMKWGLEVNLDLGLFSDVFNSAGSRNGSVENTRILEKLVREALKQQD